MKPWNIRSLRGPELFFLLSIISESVYLASSLTNVPALLRTILAFPACYILPGMMLVLVLRAKMSLVKLMVVGFFASTIISVLFASCTFMLGFHLTQSRYSLVMVTLVLCLALLASRRKVELETSKHDVLLVTLALSMYAILVVYFVGIQRYFSFDETFYIFSARMGVIEGVVPPFGVQLNAIEFTAFIRGRYFWSYLLSTFLISTGLPSYEAGLVGVGFLIMTALASSLLVKHRRLAGPFVFIVVAMNPALFSFSGLAINDLAIAFYIVFSVVFFVQSFRKVEGNVSIDLRNLFISLLGFIPLVLIKLNLLVVFPVWLMLMYIIFRYKLYKGGRTYKLLSLFVSLPVLAYELCVDVPYVVYTYILRNTELANRFGKFVVVSLLRNFVLFFKYPSARSGVNYVEYFYSLMSPDSSGLLISAVILAIPILILSRNVLRWFDERVLAILVLLSVGLQYFETLVVIRSVYIFDIFRYSLWMVPLCIPLAFVTLHGLAGSRPLGLNKVKPIVPVVIAAGVLMWMNIALTMESGRGVYVGFGYWRWMTTDGMVIQLLCLVPLLVALASAGTIQRRLRAVKVADVALGLIIVVLLLNAASFSAQSVGKNWQYEDRSFTAISDKLNSYVQDGSLVLANNYVFMRSYVSDKLFTDSLILPPPPTREKFLSMLELVPDNTLILISNDTAATGHEYANAYIKDYLNSSVITADEQNSTVSAQSIDHFTTPTGSVSIYRVNRENVRAFEGIAVYDAGTILNPNSTVTVKLQVVSSEPGRVNVLISNDRAIDIYSSSLVAGRNDLEYPSYQTDGWVIVMTENGTIVYKNYVVHPSPTRTNGLLIASMATTLSLFAALSWKKEDL